MENYVFDKTDATINQNFYAFRMQKKQLETSRQPNFSPSPVPSLFLFLHVAVLQFKWESREAATVLNTLRKRLEAHTLSAMPILSLFVPQWVCRPLAAGFCRSVCLQGIAIKPNSSSFFILFLKINLAYVIRSVGLL